MHRVSALLRTSILGLTALFTIPVMPAHAHFGAIIPRADIVTQSEEGNLTLDIAFLHPLEQQYMEMARPKQFGVLHRGKQTDLTASLRPVKAKGPGQNNWFTRWEAEYAISRPGDYTFFVQPQPYWEEAEDSFILHYTKVCVHGFGLELGWDTPVGLPTEIVPLTRPYGLWTANLFTGQVLVNGQPAPFAEVEVEYLNSSPDNPSPIQPPSAPYVTQVVKADSNGIFSYAMPRQGWWGFAALSPAEWTLPHDGKDKAVELGAVYWVHTADMR